jgi:hypothetical protein
MPQLWSLLTTTPENTTRGRVMISEQHNVESNDSLVDARAIFVLILIAVATAVFWVSQQ